MRSLFAFVLLMCSTLVWASDAPKAAAAPRAVVTVLNTYTLPEYPGKEALMILVEYPPGSVDPVHRHKAHAFIYVIEGSIVMGLNGGKSVTLSAGQTYHEGPTDLHSTGRNASTSKPARFVVTLIKDIGAPVLIPAP